MLVSGRFELRKETVTLELRTRKEIIMKFNGNSNIFPAEGIDVVLSKFDPYFIA